jgi:hypothetical protein
MYLPPLLSDEQKRWASWEHRKECLRERIAAVGVYSTKREVSLFLGGDAEVGVSFFFLLSS